MLLEERVGQAITEAEAVRFARELYGLDIAAKSLPGEYDDNFHLTTILLAPKGRSDFVLKFMHPARERPRRTVPAAWFGCSPMCPGKFWQRSVLTRVNFCKALAGFWARWMSL